MGCCSRDSRVYAAYDYVVIRKKEKENLDETIELSISWFANCVNMSIESTNQLVAKVNNNAARHSNERASSAY